MCDTGQHQLGLGSRTNKSEAKWPPAQKSTFVFATIKSRISKIRSVSESQAKLPGRRNGNTAIHQLIANLPTLKKFISCSTLAQPTSHGIQRGPVDYFPENFHPRAPTNRRSRASIRLNGLLVHAVPDAAGIVPGLTKETHTRNELLNSFLLATIWHSR